MGYAYSLWYQSGGNQGEKPNEPELLDALALLKAGPSMPEAERNAAAQRIWKLAADQVWAIGLAGQSPAYTGIRVVSNRLENVPDRTRTSQQCRTP
jgi:ABC-type transport system substrate-binding protein